MSCKAFLRSFAYQYCRHKYIRNAVRFDLSTSIKSSSFCSIDDYYYLRNAEIDWHDDFGSKFVAMDPCFGRGFDKNLTATINQEKLLRLPCSLLLRSLSRPIEKNAKKNSNIHYCHDPSLADQEWMKKNLSLRLDEVTDQINQPNLKSVMIRKWSVLVNLILFIRHSLKL